MLTVFAAAALVAGYTPFAAAQDPEPAAPIEEPAAPIEDPAAPAAPEAPAEPDAMMSDAEALTFDGELVSVDAEAKTLTVKKADGTEMQFSYSDATEISGASDEAAGLATETGSQVTVNYTSEGDVHTASKIEVRAAEEAVE